MFDDFRSDLSSGGRVAVVCGLFTIVTSSQTFMENHAATRRLGRTRGKYWKRKEQISLQRKVPRHSQAPQESELW